MTDETNFEPYQEGDFVEDGEGYIIGYKGTISKVVYPGIFDFRLEAKTWSERGYHLVPKRIDEGSGYFSIGVLGDITEAKKDELWSARIRVESIKERGKEVPYPVIL